MHAADRSCMYGDRLLNSQGLGARSNVMARLVALFGVAGLMVYSMKVVLAQQNAPFSDPVVDGIGLTAIAIALAWQLFGWTQH
jgi:hypothetical protein